MATRTRQDLVQLPGGDGLVYSAFHDDSAPLYIGPVSPGWSAHNHAYFGEAITSFKGTNGRFRPCFHTRYNSKIQQLDPGQYLLHPPSAVFKMRPIWAQDGSSPQNVDRLSFNLHAAGTVDITPQQWGELDTRALAVMLPSMQAGVSLTNFLLELKDFRYVFQRDSGPLIKRAKKFLKALKPSQRNIPFREVSKLILFKEFALDPFIADIGDIVTGLRTWRRRLKDLESRANRIQQRHFSFKLEEYAGVPNSSTVNSGARIWLSHFNSVEWNTKYDWVVSPVYNSTCRYVYSLGENTRARGREMDAILDTLGLRNDISILWNAIPFSFIVDWFVNISEVLHRFSSDQTGITIEVLDFCSSIKSLLHSELTCHHRDLFLSTNTNGEKMKVYDATLGSYDRRVNIPNLSAALSMSGLSAKEAYLSAALIGANVPRYRK